MLIVCPSCATSYDVNLASLSPNGRQVRCVRCRTIWHAEPSHADKLMHAAAALAPERDVPTDGAEDAVDRTADELASARLEPFRRATDEQTSTAPATALGRNGEPAEQIERGYSDEVEAPPIVPIDLDEERPRAGRDRRVHVPEPEESGGAQDIESVAARRLRAKRGSLRWPLSRLQTGILALALLDTILVGWRSDVVRELPQTASFYSLLGLSVNLRGLVFDNVATVTEQHEGVPILVVEGNVVNTTRKNEDVPRLNSSYATRRSTRFIPGPQFPCAPRCRRARALAFGPAWHRRPPMHAMSSFVLSTAAIWSPQTADIPWHAFS